MKKDIAQKLTPQKLLRYKLEMVLLSEEQAKVILEFMYEMMEIVIDHTCTTLNRR